MHSTLSLRSFPDIAFEMVPMFVWWMMVFSLLSRKIVLCFLFPSLLQAINGMMSLALCLQVVSQASQHLRSSEKQATSEGCFAHQSICSVISFYFGMSRAVQLGHIMDDISAILLFIEMHCKKQDNHRLAIYSLSSFKQACGWGGSFLHLHLL